VPRIPPWRLAAGLEWTTERLSLGAEVHRAGRQDRPGALDSETPGYTSLDAHLDWRVAALRDLNVTLLGRNLTDTEQRNAASFNKDALLLPGRDVRLLVRLQF
jgi:iron complex outermembrane receptor protein